MANGVFKDNERKTYYIDKRHKGVRIYKRGFPSMTEAKTYLNRAIYDIDNPITSRIVESATLNDLFDKWLVFKSTEIRATTLQRYSDTYRVEICPFFGDFLCSTLSIDKLTEWKAKLCAKGNTTSYVNGVLTIFKLILIFGIDSDYKIDKKILVTLKQVKDNKPTPEREILSYEQIDKFLATFNLDDEKEKMYHDYFYLLSRTGMRPNEFRGLQVRNIKGDYLVVDHDITSKLKGQGDVLQAPKNSSSIREVIMPKECMDIIRERTKGYKANEFIFGKELALRETNLRRYLNKHLKMAELHPITIYGFRHSHATHLIRSGVPIKVVSKRLGHSTPTMTMQVYWHLFKEDEESVLQYL